MEVPPTYEEAQNPNVWKILAKSLASSIPPGDLGSLCRVSKHFNAVFNPLLWQRPTDIIHENFVAFLKHIRTCRSSVVEMVDILDFRFEQTWRNCQARFGGRSLDDLPHDAWDNFPELKVLIIDGLKMHFPSQYFVFEEFPMRPWSIQNPDSLPPNYLRPKLKNLLFSAAGCPNLIPELILQMPFCYTTLYLDLSRTKIGGFPELANATRLPCLRILKLRGTGLTNRQLEALGQGMKRSLWSLDVRDNLLNVDCIPILDRHYHFKSQCRDRSWNENYKWRDYERLMTDWDTRSTIESALPPELQSNPVNKRMHRNLRLENSEPDPDGYVAQGQPVETCDEIVSHHYLSSDRAWDYTRYLEDPPSYTPSDYFVPLEIHQTAEDYRKFVGDAALLRPDSIDDLMGWYLDHPESFLSYPNFETPEIMTKKTGLTHLYLSGNKFPGRSRVNSREPGLEAYSVAHDLLCKESHLEALDCDGLHEAWAEMQSSFYVQEPIEKYTFISPLSNYTDIQFTGHCRPLPHNLVYLRVHHSFITATKYIPEARRPSGRARIEAEDAKVDETTFICFRPNQNPKLKELVLTDVPRKSLGKVISRLKHLIHNAADQKLHLMNYALDPALTNHRHPKLLAGLETIVFEFRPLDDADARINNRSVTGDVDADVFHEESRGDFSFFEDENDRERDRQEEEEREKQRELEKMEDLIDVVDSLREFRENTYLGKYRSVYWGGKLMLLYDGLEVNLTGIIDR